MTGQSQRSVDHGRRHDAASGRRLSYAGQQHHPHRAVTIAGTNSLALNGTISGASGSLTQTDIGTLLLGGANSFGGGVTVNAGILALGTDTAAGAGPLAFNNNVSILPVNSARTLGNAVSLGASANLTVTGTFDLTFNGIISGPGAITHTSSNVLTLNGANSFGGGSP